MAETPLVHPNGGDSAEKGAVLEAAFGNYLKGKR